MTLLQLFERRDPALTKSCGSALAARDRLRLLFAQERAAAAEAGKTAEISPEALSSAQAACIRAIRSGKVTRRRFPWRPASRLGEPQTCSTRFANKA